MDTFEADAISLHSLFMEQTNATSFRVPNYQRDYNWGEDNINRFFDDIRSGLMELYSSKQGIDSKRFIGTVILLKENSLPDEFKGLSFAIVDGQQRLTTASLMAVSLHQALSSDTSHKAEGIPSKISDWIEAELDDVIQRLGQCIYGLLFTKRGVSSYPFPRIVREGDMRGSSHLNKDYKSLVARYLFQYAKHVLGLDASDPTDAPLNAGLGKSTDEKVAKNIGFIKKDILKLTEETLESDGSKQSSIQHLFEAKLSDKRKASLISKAMKLDRESIINLLTLICFSNYTLDNVLVTRVIAASDKYAFDIFDALNTTGQPLTAIETLKPQVINFEESPKKTGYSGSESESALDSIEKYLSDKSSTDRQLEAKDIVVSFALYLTGETLPRRLNIQRNYLRKFQQDIVPSNHYHDDAKRQFVINMADIVDYKDSFWKKGGEFGSKLPAFENRDLVLMLLSFLLSMRHSLTIPILCRYYVESRDGTNGADDWDNFSQAVKALTAFIAIRRAATGGTASIDATFRGLMAQGSPKKDGDDGLHRGLFSDRPIISIKKLKGFLKEWLQEKSIDINDKKSWVARASSQKLYDDSASLCRFLLMAAAHNARPVKGEPWKLRKVNPSPELDYMNLKRWESKPLATVEHIAPQKDTSRAWPKNIYSEVHLIDSLGNLTLLPKDKNSKIGNASWKVKKLFFKAFAAEGEEEIQQTIETAKKKGVEFGDTEKSLQKSEQLPIARTIAAAEEWNDETIKQRTNEILGLAWDEISPWLLDD